MHTKTSISADNGQASQKDGTKKDEKCEDKKGPDGTAYTDWCKAKIVGKPKGSPFSCFGPLDVQLRCMKSCKICEDSNAASNNNGAQ